jgi:hypothetical protein
MADACVWRKSDEHSYVTYVCGLRASRRYSTCTGMYTFIICLAAFLPSHFLMRELRLHTTKLSETQLRSRNDCRGRWSRRYCSSLFLAVKFYGVVSTLSIDIVSFIVLCGTTYRRVWYQPDIWRWPVANTPSPTWLTLVWRASCMQSISSLRVADDQTRLVVVALKHFVAF